MARNRVRKGPNVTLAVLPHPFRRKGKKPLRKPKLTPEQQRILLLRDCGGRIIYVLEEMMSAGAVRLPYPGLLETIVALKAAMKP